MEKTKKTGAGFWIPAVLTALVFAALLELNRNTLLAWGLCAVLFAAWVILRRKKLCGAGFGKRLLAWLGLAAALSLVLAFVGRPYKLRPAVEGGNGGFTDVVTLRDGQVRGVYTPDGAVEVYAGIPYAAPPVGELRWRAPQDPAPWEGVRDCDRFAPMAMQSRNAQL